MNTQEKIIRALRIVGPLSKANLIKLILTLQNFNIEEVEPNLEVLKAEGAVIEKKGKLHLNKDRGHL